VVQALHIISVADLIRIKIFYQGKKGVKLKNLVELKQQNSLVKFRASAYKKMHAY
jgi:hypothetical protein